MTETCLMRGWEVVGGGAAQELQKELELERGVGGGSVIRGRQNVQLSGRR
jgi:hypothetical protein